MKKPKLRLAAETIRHIAARDLPAVGGGAFPTIGCPHSFKCLIPTVTCPTIYCP